MNVSSASARKSTYKVTNWRKYNESLVSRGDITFWFSEEVIEAWEHDNAERKVGRPFTYSDTAIEALLTIRELFRLPYRQTEGFGRSLAQLIGVNVAIPDYTSLQKRAARLNVTIKVDPNLRGPIDVVVDSSGCKVYGEGEWRVRCYGVEKRRTWRKLHVATNPRTQEIVALVLTDNSQGDASQVEPLLDQIDQPVEKFYGDGGYDHWPLHDKLQQRGVMAIIPPQKNAVIRQHGNCAADPLPRDEHLRQIRRDGRKAWKKQIGYHRRSLAETVFSRLKLCFGDRLKNRRLENQQTEVALRCKLLNHYTKLGLPDSTWRS